MAWGLAPLIKKRQRIDEGFAAAGLQQPLEWTDTVTAGGWVIRYEVDVNYRDDPDLAKMNDLNPGRGGDEGTYSTRTSSNSIQSSKRMSQSQRSSSGVGPERRQASERAAVRSGSRTARMVLWIPAQNVVITGGTTAGRWYVSRRL